MRRAIVGAVVCLLASLFASAATFETRPWYGHRVHMTLIGEIKSGDGEIFKQEVLKQLRAGHYVSSLALYTPGGDVEAAISIGRQIRMLEAVTQAPYVNKETDKPFCTIGAQDEQVYFDQDKCDCQSACFIIWAGGVDRQGSYVGIHHPYFEKKSYGEMDPAKARKQYEEMEKSVRSYFTEMEMPEWAVNKMFRMLSKEMYFLKENEIDLLKNPQAWQTEQIYARCGDIPEGSYLTNSARRRYLDCASPIYEALERENSQKYLDRYASGEKLPPEVLVFRTNPAPAPRTGVTPPAPLPPPIPLPVTTPIPGTRTIETTGANAYYILRQNRDLDAQDILPYIKNTTQTGCAQACNNNSQCQGFSFDDWNNFCILKTNVTYSRLDPHSISGVKQSVFSQFPQGIPEYDPYYQARIDKIPNSFFIGEGYSTVPANDAQACANTCAPDRACVAYTYFKNQRTCRLFKTTGKYFKGDGTSDSGIKTQERP